MAKVYGTTLFSAAVRSIVENGEKWEIIGNEMVNEGKDIFIPVSAVERWPEDYFSCVVQVGEMHYYPYTCYFCMNSSGDVRQISFC